MAFYTIAQRPRSVSTAIHSVPGDCSARTSAICNFLQRCWNAVMTPLWFDRAFRSNVYYEASHALVSCLISPQESINLVIKLIFFSIIKIKNIVLNSKPLLFDFADVWCNLIVCACCCNICIWNVHNKHYFAMTLKALKRRRYVLFGCYPFF